ncbi:MAG: flagellar biosynthetic protein FliO [Acidimicrobiales bacterium]
MTLLSLVRMVVVLGAIIGLLVVMGRVAQRRPGGIGRTATKKSGGSVEVLSRKSLGQHVSLIVVRAGARTLLVGQSSQQMTLLTELDTAEWEAGASPAVGIKKESLVAPRLALGDEANASRAWDAIVYRLREMTVRR